MTESKSLDEKLRRDIAGLLVKINDHGLYSEEVKKFVNEKMMDYKAGKPRKEYLELAATIMFLHEQYEKKDI